MYTTFQKISTTIKEANVFLWTPYNIHNLHNRTRKDKKQDPYFLEDQKEQIQQVKRVNQDLEKCGIMESYRKQKSVKKENWEIKFGNNLSEEKQRRPRRCYWQNDQKSQKIKESERKKDLRKMKEVASSQLKREKGRKKQMYGKYK